VNIVEVTGGKTKRSELDGMLVLKALIAILKDSLK
jgi:hypothetical protein